MALPIKDTPILTGKDARELERRMAEDEKQKVSPEEYQRIVRAFRSVKVINNTKNCCSWPDRLTD